MSQARATLAAGMQVTPSVRLLSPLGAGGMGAVWLADHTALSTRVVVKFMLVALDSSASARARFKREAEAASQVKSPHVVQTFDYGVTPDGLPFIVMEHLEGRDLAAEIAARGALDPATVVAIISQVAKALSKAHGAGLLHRDIKPDNIFLCQSEAEDDLFVKLLDFGIAKAHVPEGGPELDSDTKTGQVIGTPFYMSPEQVTAQKAIDLRSDLWSLGIVAFEALTGKRPFDGPSFGALAVKIATTAPPKPSAENPALPPSVDAWFAKACAREPAERFSSAKELAERLRAAFEGVVSLPPIVSGMSESGPRTSSDPESAQTTRGPSAVPSVAAGPISVDDDAHDRPSFVLASTASSDPDIEARSPLGLSEPGGAAVAIGGGSGAPPGEPRGMTARSKLLFVVGAVALIAVAAGIRYRAKDGASSGASTSPPPEAVVKNASSAPVVAPPPAGVTLSAPTASASPSASAAPPTLADAGSVHAAVVPPPNGARPRQPSPTPAVTSAAAPSSKPSAEPAPRASARPPGHDDPLF